MRFDIITTYPQIFDSYLSASILGRAQKQKLVEIKTHNLRDFAVGRGLTRTKRGITQKNGYRKVDDKPYGGGAGMVLMAEPILKAVDRIELRIKNEELRINKKTVKGAKRKQKTKIIVFSAKGKQFDQKMAYDWAKKFDNFILVNGRYEGVDERVEKILKAEEVSIGPYVLTDGDVAGMVLISAIARLAPGVIKWESLQEESFFNLLAKKERNLAVGAGLEYPHYTRPEVLKWKGKKYSVPDVLLSGNHKEIEKWRLSKRGKS